MVVGLFLGAHVSTAGGIHTAIERIASLDGEAAQIFTQNSRTWRQTNHDPTNFDRFKQERRDASIAVVVCHAIYLINLATPDEGLYRKSIETLVRTLEIAEAIGADAVVLHVGSHLGSGFDTGVERAIPAIKEALTRVEGQTFLLLENSAGAGGTMGRSIEELAVLVDSLDRHPRVGVCLDSCHLWVSGVDVTKPETMDELISEVDSRMGLERLRALHVNDAATELGSNRDRHANIGEGRMDEGLGAFVAHPAVQDLPAILEVPGPDNKGPDANELQKLRALHARWTASG